MTFRIMVVVVLLGFLGLNPAFSANISPSAGRLAQYPGGKDGIAERAEGNEFNRSGIMGRYDGSYVKILYPERSASTGRSWHVAEDGSDSEGDGSLASPFASIQHGMISAVSGDTVLVECGIYFENDIDLQAGVVLRSETGDPGCVTIDAQEISFAMGCIYSSNISVEGLTVINGKSNYAGAMWFGYTTNIRVVDCNLYSNYATQMGGGIYCYDSEILVSNLTVSDNYAGWQGSGIAMNDGGSAIIQNSIVSSNVGSVALYCISEEIIDLYCSNIFGNPDGDWIGCVQGDQDINGNMSVDPLYCDQAMGEYSLASESPCAAGNNLGCGQIGALDVGCSVSGVVEQSLIRKYQLLPCYPNPFNPRTTIAFEIPSPQDVTLRVFDLSGRLVRDLIVGESRFPGRHEVLWNGRDDVGRRVASGTYFYRLEGGGFANTMRMVLVK